MFLKENILRCGLVSESIQHKRNSSFQTVNNNVLKLMLF